MGLDIYIDKCRKPTMVDGRRDYEEREEVCYWRKFWGLLREGLPFDYMDDEYAQDVRLSKKDIEHILDYVTHNRDYFDWFSGVEQVCRLLDEYDYLTEQEGWIIVFNANW